MTELKTLADAEAALQPFWPANNKHRHSLDFMVDLMAYLDNPQDKLRVVHVAGTSGKTSTSYYTAALLQAAGKKVGLTVSPHVDALNERVQINLVPLPEADFCRELTEFLELLAKEKLEPTYFELMIAFAFWEFVRQGVDYAVVEVGVGGLLDSTNVSTRADKVCVITDIGMDHTKILGDTLAEIAAQKAGIILPHNTVFCHQQADEVMDVFRDTAARQQADLRVLTGVEPQPETKDLPLFQQRNYGLALVAAGYVLQRDGHATLDDAARQQAANTYIPARMETVQLQGKTLIMDAAHNAQKLEALTKSVRAKYPDQDVAVLAGLIVGRDTRVKAATKAICDLAHHLVLSGFSGGSDGPVHSMDPQELADICRTYGFADLEVIADPEVAFRTLCARPEPVLLVTGSFYLLNHIRPLVRAAS